MNAERTKRSLKRARKHKWDDEKHKKTKVEIATVNTANTSLKSKMHNPVQNACQKRIWLDKIAKQRPECTLETPNVVHNVTMKRQNALENAHGNGTTPQRTCQK